jgi:hypothetical protein
MKKQILTIFFFTIHIIVSAQSCFPEGISFETQSAVDSFQINYPNCTEILGNLEIINSEIVSLEGLSVIAAVNGNLEINTNEYLTSLNGLHNITSVGGSLIIRDNDLLTSVNGLNSLEVVDGVAMIAMNDQLPDLAGLNSLNTVGWLVIGSNEQLASLNGINNLTSVSNSVDIVDNQSLDHLEGLNSLSTIGGNLTLYFNDNLIHLDGLNGLEFVDGELQIRYNASLISINGLSNIDPEFLYSFEIESNISLANCAINSLCEYFAISGCIIVISGNAAGCNNQEEVLEACTTNSLSEIDNNSDYLMYPNPVNRSSAMITINPQIREISIINQYGRVVLHKKVTSRKVDISTLGQGVYIAELRSNKVINRQKLVIN